MTTNQPQERVKLPASRATQPNNQSAPPDEAE